MASMVTCLATVLLPILAGQLTRATVEFSYPSVVDHGGYIKVSWTASNLDTIGVDPEDEVRLYCPPLLEGAALPYPHIDAWPLSQVLTKSSKAPQYGAVVVGPLVNMRVQCEIRFWHYNMSQAGFLPVSTSSSPVFSFREGATQPLQGHVAQTGTPGELSVTWVSSIAASDGASLWYHPTSNPSAVIKKKATISTYTASDMCGDNASVTSPTQFRDPGFIYTTVMAGLRPSTTYTYWYGSALLNATSPKRTIMSPQSTDSSTANARILAYADMGAWGGFYVSSPSWNSSAMTVVDVVQNQWFAANKRVDLIAHIGDISYALGKGYVWERFFYRIEPIATLAPYHVAIGNHEYDYAGTFRQDPSGADTSYHPQWGNFGSDSKGECGVPVYRRFKMPKSPGSNSVFWYSHNVANVHMVYISTEHDLSPRSVQATWLRQDLAAVNRNKQPWVVVSGHRPLYNNEARLNDRDLPVQMKLRQFLGPVFAEFNVTLFVGGHYHNYVRTCSLDANGTCVTSGGTMHVTVGTAGADLSAKSFHSKPWALKTSSTHGVLSIETSGNSSMTVQYRDTRGSVVDSAILQLSNEYEPTTPSRTSSGNTGLIVGVIIGCITVVIIATFALWFLRHKLPDSVKNSDEPSSGTNTSDGMEVPLEGDFDADTTDASV